MSKQILMCDFKNIGHHWIYNYTVMKRISETNTITYFTSNICEDQTMLLEKLGISVVEIETQEYSNKIKSNLSIFKNVLRCFRYAEKNNISLIHFFTLDFILIQLFLIKLFKNRNVSATIHWLPNNKIKLFFLHLNLKFALSKLVVHGDYIKEKIALRLDFKNMWKLNSIVYPAFEENEVTEKDDALKVLGMENCDEKILLYFGEMRKDKGIDILLDALKDIKAKYKLIVAGKPEYFTKEYILERAVGFNNVILDLEYVSDSKLALYFSMADIVILPYRSWFSGQSGPLTDGVKHKCMIIAPNVGQIGNTVVRYKIGKTFEVENSKSLAKVIDECIFQYNEWQKEHIKYFDVYNRLSSVSVFVAEYEKILR